jgi:ferrous iron transport protein B
MLGLYLLGIVVAMATATLMRKVMFKKDETPFVMELPPYRMPTLRATVSHMWQRCAQYLRNVAGMILVASIVVWALGYFPRQEESDLSLAERYEHSYIGHVGQLCEPAFEPLGLDWKASVSLLSGVAAKELMVSTLGVLYSNDTDNNPAQLKQNLASSGDFTTPSALALLVFTLLYMPCIGTITAIGSESGWKWAIASAVYSTAVAWLCAFAVYHIAQLFM